MFERNSTKRERKLTPTQRALAFGAGVLTLVGATVGLGIAGATGGHECTPGQGDVCPPSTTVTFPDKEVTTTVTVPETSTTVTVPETSTTVTVPHTETTLPAVDVPTPTALPAQPVPQPVDTK